MAVVVPVNDTALEAAAQEARESLDKFIGHLAHPKPNQSDFSIKAQIHDGGMGHVMWLQGLAFDGTDFTGFLGPDAAGLKTHNPGDRIAVAPKDVEDWMFVENGKLVGGFSLRAIRGRLTGEARNQFVNSLWFKFE